MKKASGLGKGLSALISERQIDIGDFAESTGKKGDLPVGEVFPGRFQPRVIFDNDEMDELTESIRRNGVVQPILVRKRQGRGYELIAGERRWRSSKKLKLKTIPAIILDIDDRQAMEIGLIENVQRQNLKVLEEADGYKRLIKEFDYTQEQLADVMGKSRSYVTNLMRLLALPDEVKAHLNKGELSTGHARALLTAPDPVFAASEIIEKKFSVRQTENFVKKLTSSSGGIVVRKKYSRKKKSDLAQKDNNTSSDSYSNSVESSEMRVFHVKKEKEPEISMMEDEISSNSGFTVEILNDNESGKVVIDYADMTELNKILKKLEL